LVQCEKVQLSGDATQLAAELRALVPASGSVQQAVTEIVAEVRSRGDEALNEYTRRFDTRGADPPPLRVSDEELDAALESTPEPVRAGLRAAAENVRRVAQATLAEDGIVEFGAHAVRLRHAPVARAAVYVPGGRAPYPSTVVMGVVPARVAQVPEVAVAAPPGGDGDVDPVVLAACKLSGASTVYRMGGAQAIAALAYGTETVEAVEVIVGPGNLYVQEAKRQVFGQVGIDGFAGPSDLVVIADGDADLEAITLDLLAQSEHGPGTLVIAISTDAALLDELSQRLTAANDTGAISRLVAVKTAQDALELAEALAPEHLQLVGASVEVLAPQVSRAGCLFVGPLAGTAFGDYIAGSNHILPTAGAARYASGLSPNHFRRSFSQVAIKRARELAAEAAPVARAEGFELHARSMETRIRDNE
jgi:histidinol dehydrogenase